MEQDLVKKSEESIDAAFVDEFMPKRRLLLLGLSSSLASFAIGALYTGDQETINGQNLRAQVSPNTAKKTQTPTPTELIVKQQADTKSKWAIRWHGVSAISAILAGLSFSSFIQYHDIWESEEQQPQLSLEELVTEQIETIILEKKF